MVFASASSFLDGKICALQEPSIIIIIILMFLSETPQANDKDAILPYTAVHCVALYCIALYYITLYCTALCCNALYCIAQLPSHSPFP